MKKNPTTKPPSPSRISVYTIGLAIFATIVNLLIFNDVAAFRPLFELPVLTTAAETIRADWAPIPARLLDHLNQLPPDKHFLMRLPAAMATFLTFSFLYFLGKRIFGEMPARVATLIAAASWVLLFFGKLAGADAWMVLAQTLQVFGTIYFLKQPRPEWSVLANLAFINGLCVLPWPMLTSTLSLVLFYGIFHPNGKHLWRPVFWAPMAVSIVVVMVFGGYGWVNPLLIAGWPNGGWRWYGWMVLGILPWLAFFIPAVWDSVKKFKQREELAIIYLGWLLAALLSGTGLLGIIMAVMAGRHVLFYFQNNYPYQPRVRGLLVLNFIAAFFAMFGLTMWAGLHFGGAGYRTALTVAIVYWGGSLFGVVAAFTKNRRNLIGSLGVACILGFLMFWLNVFPLLESRWGWEKRVVEKVSPYIGSDTSRILFFQQTPEKETASARYYADAKGLDFIPAQTKDLRTLNKQPGDLLAIPKAAVSNQDLLIVRDSFMFFPQGFGDGTPYYIGKWGKLDR